MELCEPKMYCAQELSPDALQELIDGEWEDAAVFLTLSRRQEGGRNEACLRRLYEEEQAHADCLKSLYTLTTRAHPTQRTVPDETEPAEAVLRVCYGRQMRRLAAYEARSKEPSYGAVFTRLAQQEREHCRIVLDLIKKTKKKTAAT